MSIADAVSTADLAAFDAVTSALHTHAPDVHRLAVERIDILAEAYGPREHVLESAREFVERVYAHVFPIPAEQCGFDEGNSYYENVRVMFDKVVYSGTYPVWSADGEYRTAFATVSVPTWVVTDADGHERYRAETETIAEKIRTDFAEERRKVDEVVAAVMAEAARTPQESRA